MKRIFKCICTWKGREEFLTVDVEEEIEENMRVEITNKRCPDCTRRLDFDKRYFPLNK